MKRQIVAAPTKLIAIGRKMIDLRSFSPADPQLVGQHRDRQPEDHRERRHDHDPQQGVEQRDLEVTRSRAGSV